VDRTFDTQTRSKMIQRLELDGQPDVLGAVARCYGLHLIGRLSGEQEAWLYTELPADGLLLAGATRSLTRSEFPGPLDRAFEAALSDHRWPIVRIVVGRRSVNAA
jgi:hypothetical protein